VIKHVKAAGLGLGILAALGIVITLFVKVPFLFILTAVTAVGWALGNWILAVKQSRKERAEAEKIAAERRRTRGW
jgi:hypothetical protein